MGYWAWQSHRCNICISQIQHLPTQQLWPSLSVLCTGSFLLLITGTATPQHMLVTFVLYVLSTDKLFSAYSCSEVNFCFGPRILPCIMIKVCELGNAWQVVAGWSAWKFASGAPPHCAKINQCAELNNMAFCSQGTWYIEVMCELFKNYRRYEVQKKCLFCN